MALGHERPPDKALLNRFASQEYDGLTVLTGCPLTVKEVEITVENKNLADTMYQPR